jgi:hypothetical protein
MCIVMSSSSSFLRVNVVLVFTFVFLSSMLLVVNPVGARTITVPDDYSTISEAIQNARSGDIIFVKRGIYNEHTLRISFSLSLIGEGKAETIIRNIDGVTENPGLTRGIAPMVSAIEIQAENVVISGFKIEVSPLRPYLFLNGITGITESTQITDNIIKAGQSISFDNHPYHPNPKGIDLVGNNNQITKNEVTSTIILEGDYNSVSHNSAQGIHLKRSGEGNNSVVANTIGELGINLKSGADVIWGNIVNSKDGIKVSAFSIVVENSVNNVYDKNIGGYPFSFGIMGSHNCIVFNNNVFNFGPGIKICGGYQRVFDNTLENSGINLFQAYSVFVYGNKISKGSIIVSESYDNVIFANEVSNAPIGLELGGAQSEIQFRQNGADSDNNTLCLNNFINNAVQVRSDYSLGYRVYGNNRLDNGLQGNFWSDYRGVDADGDGICDTPYIIDDQRRDNYPLMKPFDISKSSEVALNIYHIKPINVSSIIDPCWIPLSTPKSLAESVGEWLGNPVMIAALVIIITQFILIIVLIKNRRNSSTLM